MEQRFRVFDADLHHQFPSGAAIAKYLPERTTNQYYNAGRAVPHVDGAYRLDAVPPGGGVPGSDPGFVVSDHLDRHRIDFAILNCGSILGISTMHDVDRAAELARAANDWTVEGWFPVDQRFLGSVHVATSDPEQAAAEIRRMGSHPRMVQVCATGLPCPMGSQFLYPIWEACCEVGLPFTLHQSGLRGSEMKPTTFVELHVDMCLQVLPHFVSLVLEGVFEKYPDLTVVFNEYGIAWIPFLLWRMDMEYRAGRDELPWLKRLPSEYVVDHIRFTTQPLEEPRDRRDLIKLLETFDGERMLMFSSDYPHWDADNPEYALKGFPDEWKERIFFENAREVFKLDSRLAGAVATAGAQSS
jgi:predicted TIM-barrel fold metal-dependent hydrolase